MPIRLVVAVHDEEIGGDLRRPERRLAGRFPRVDAPCGHVTSASSPPPAGGRRAAAQCTCTSSPSRSCSSSSWPPPSSGARTRRCSPSGTATTPTPRTLAPGAAARSWPGGADRPRAGGRDPRAAAPARRPRRWLGWGLAALALAGCLLLVSPAEVAAALRRVSPAGTRRPAAAGHPRPAAHGPEVGRAAAPGRRPPAAARAVRLFYQASAVGTLLPSHLGGDLLRGWWAAREGAPGHPVAASLVMERLLGLVSAANWAVLGAVLLAVHRAPGRAWAWAGLGLLAALAGDGLFAFSLSRPAHALVLRRLGRLGRSWPARLAPAVLRRLRALRPGPARALGRGRAGGRGARGADAARARDRAQHRRGGRAGGAAGGGGAVPAGAAAAAGAGRVGGGRAVGGGPARAGGGRGGGGVLGQPGEPPRADAGAGARGGAAAPRAGAAGGAARAAGGGPGRGGVGARPTLAHAPCEGAATRRSGAAAAA